MVLSGEVQDRHFGSFLDAGSAGTAVRSVSVSSINEVANGDLEEGSGSLPLFWSARADAGDVVPSWTTTTPYSGLKCIKFAPDGADVAGQIYQSKKLNVGKFSRVNVNCFSKVVTTGGGAATCNFGVEVIFYDDQDKLISTIGTLYPRNSTSHGTYAASHSTALFDVPSGATQAVFSFGVSDMSSNCEVYVDSFSGFRMPVELAAGSYGFPLEQVQDSAGGSYPAVVASGINEAAAPAHSVQVGFTDAGGDLVAVSAANPLPATVTGSGGDGAILDGVSSAIKATVKDYANSNPLTTILVDTNGDPIAVGGGTQYADGDVRGTATGTIAMVDDGTNIQSMSGDSSGRPNVNVVSEVGVGSTGAAVPATASYTGIRSTAGNLVGAQGQNTNADDIASASGGNMLGVASYSFFYDGSTWDRVRGDSTDGLLVNLGANNDITGTVTANAGTNLNTSALALEAGGNLAAAATSLATLDNIVSGSEAQVDVVAALPAGTNLIGKVSAGSDTASMYEGATALTPKFAIIDAATSGNNTLVAAVASKKVRVLSLMLVASGAVVVRFESGAGGTALSGQMNLVANVGFTLPFSPVGWFETGTNTLLNLELDAAVSVDGMLTYIEVS